MSIGFYQRSLLQPRNCAGRLCSLPKVLEYADVSEGAEQVPLTLWQAYDKNAIFNICTRPFISCKLEWTRLAIHF